MAANVLANPTREEESNIDEFTGGTQERLRAMPIEDIFQNHFASRMAERTYFCIKFNWIDNMLINTRTYI